MGKKSIAVFAIAFGIFWFLFTAQAANAATNCTVTASILNVRTGPGVGYSKITEIKDGQVYPVIESQNGWYRLQIDSKSGWVSGDYIKLSATQSTPATGQQPEPSPIGNVKVTADLLNVRQSADVSSKKLGTIEMGEIYQYFEKSGIWYKIKLGSSYGWIHGDYVSVINPETTAPPTNLPSGSDTGSTSPTENTTPTGDTPPAGGTTVVDSITANEDSLNVVKDAGFNSQVIGQLTKGNSYPILESRFGWYKISYDSKEGWVRNRGVSANNSNIPDLDTLYEIGSIRSYKTATKNMLAIPVTLKVDRNSSVTSPKPDVVCNKTSDGKITITINKAFFSGTGWNTIVNNNELLSAINITSLNNNTVLITVNPKTSLDYEISYVAGDNVEDGQYKYLSTYIVMNLKKTANTGSSESNVVTGPKNGQGKTKNNYIIALDAGHGGSAYGAVSNGYEEKELTFDITTKLNNILKAQGYDTYMTRDKDEYVTLSERADGPNILKTDIFISIHLNSFTSGTANGIETLYNAQAVVPGTQLAGIIQKNLTANLNRNNRGIVNRPDLAVLNSTYMPAALAEIMFMSNSEELALITQENTRQKAAQAIANAVNEYFGFGQ